MSDNPTTEKSKPHTKYQGWIQPVPLIELTPEEWKEYWRPKPDWYINM